MKSEGSVAAEVSTDPWDVVISSRLLTRVGIFLALAALIVHSGAAIMLMYDVQRLGVTVEHIDQLGLIILGVVFASLFLTLTRPRLRAGHSGVEVRGFFTTRFVGWPEIWGLAFPSNARCARLELDQYEFVAVWALNRWDRKALAESLHRYVDVQDLYSAKE